VRAAARFMGIMASQSWCGQSVVRALRPAPERTHDFEIWPRISRNPSNPKPVTLEMCGVSVRLWCEARLSGGGAVGPRFTVAPARLSAVDRGYVTCEWAVWRVQ